MPRRKTFSLVTILREAKPESSFTPGGIVSVDVAEDLALEELTARLAAPADGAFQVERRVFHGPEIPWTPSVRLGAPRKRKAKDEKPQAEKSTRTRKPREQKPDPETKSQPSEGAV